MNFRNRIIIFSAVFFSISYTSYGKPKEERFVNHTNNDVATVSNIEEKTSSQSKYLVKKISNIPAGYNVTCKELSEENMCSNIFVTDSDNATVKYVGIPNNEKAINYKYYLELVKGDNRLENHIVDFSDIKQYPPYIFQVVENGKTLILSSKDIKIDPNNQAIIIYKIENLNTDDSLLNFDNSTNLYDGSSTEPINISSIELVDGKDIIEFQNNSCNEFLKMKNCSFSLKILNKDSNKVPKIVFKDISGNEIANYNIIISKITESIEEKDDIRNARLLKLHKDSLYTVREIINIPENFTVACEPNVMANVPQKLQPTENCINELIFNEAFHKTTFDEKEVNAYFIGTDKSNFDKKYKLLFKNKVTGKEIPFLLGFQDTINGELINQVEEYIYYAKPTIGLNVAPDTNASKIYELTLNNKNNNVFEINMNDVYRLKVENLKTLKSRNTANITFSKVEPNGISMKLTQNYNDFLTVVNNTCLKTELVQNKCYIELKGKKFVDKNKIFLTITNKDNYSQDFSISVDMLQ